MDARWKETIYINLSEVVTYHSEVDFPKARWWLFEVNSAPFQDTNQTIQFLLIDWSSSLGDLVIFQIYVLSNKSSPVDAPIPLLHSEKAGNLWKIIQNLN